MFKLKPIHIALCAIVLILGLCGVWKVVDQHIYTRKLVLAQDIRKVMDYLMFDLQEARQKTLAGVPLDGKWHDHLAFAHATGRVEYSAKEGRVIRLGEGKRMAIADHIALLRIRRQAAQPAIAEVQIEARDGVSLISNFKIRMQD